MKSSPLLFIAAAGLFACALSAHPKIVQVSSSGSGTLMAIDQAENIYLWGGKQWSVIEGKLTQISVGSKTEIWGVNSRNEVFRLGANGWQRMPGLLKSIFVAKGGSMTVGIDLNSQPVQWNGSGWVGFKNAPAMVQIVAAPPSKIIGINSKFETYCLKSDGRWLRLRGAFKKISIGEDGSIAGITPDNKLQVRKDANKEAEANDPNTPSEYTEVNLPVKDVDIVNGSLALIVDGSGQIVQHNVIFPPPSVMTNVVTTLVLNGSPTINMSPVNIEVPPGSVILEPKDLAPQAVIDTNVCVPVEQLGTLDTTQSTTPVTLIQHDVFCLSGELRKIGMEPVPPPPDTGLFKTIGLGAVAAFRALSLGPPGDSPSPYTHVARVPDSVPPACTARIFSNMSKHSWVRFEIPAGKAGQLVSIPGGAYNKYVLPACNRVWWTNLKFMCEPASKQWQLLDGKYNADALCDGSPGSSPYVRVGER